MKLRSVLSGIAALLLVGVFYSFAFCMVKDVNDAPISMDYYYSTETDNASGEYNGKATTAFAAGEKDAVDEALAEAPVVTNRYDAIKSDALSIPASNAPDDEAVHVTQVPNEFAESNDTPYEEVGGYSYDGVNGELDKSNSVINDDGDYPADDDDTYEDPVDDDKALAVTQNFMASDNDIINEELSNESNDTTTIVPGAPSITEAVPLTVSEAPSVPAGEVVITVLNEGAEAVETAVYTPSGASGADISTSETLSVKYGGTTHTFSSFDVVCQIVNNEVSTSFSDEAIKAQAVAAYSYVKYNNINGIAPSVLCKPNPPQRIIDMVSSVWGKCCYYNGQVAQTVYMASSSGYTASSVNVWGGNIPYLTSVYCPFDAGDPNYGTVTKFSESAIKSSLESCLGITLSDNPENWLTITDYVDGNYVSKVSVDGQTTISGKKLRERIFGYKLKSASFDISYSDGYFYITTYGWGHGVGMSQNGANILAKQGYSYRDILKFYYTGIEVL